MILKFTGEFDTFNLPGVQRADRPDDRGRGPAASCSTSTSLKFINSAALGYLIKTARRVKEKGGEMVLARPSKFMQKTLVTLGLDGVFKAFETVEDGIIHFKKGDDVRQDPARGRRVRRVADRRGADPLPQATGPKDNAPPNQVGRIVTLYEDGLLFRYEPPARTTRSRRT